MTIRILHNRFVLLGLTVLVLLLSPAQGAAQYASATPTADTVALPESVVSLQQCRNHALQNSKSLKMSQEKNAAAEDLRKAALSQFFPRLTANGIYNWNQSGLHLLSDEQEARINSMGSSVHEHLASSIMDVTSQLPIGQEIIQDLLDCLGNGQTVANLNSIGHDITQALDIDMRNVYAGSVNINQPVYMGGKLRALYKSASMLSQLSQLQYDQQEEQLMVAVDEAYWRVVNVQHKQQLAQQYYDLLDKLCQDVEVMLEAEVASQSDATKVRVKKNEAQMSLTKANVGLQLCRMVLNQLVGFPLDSVYRLEEAPLQEMGGDGDGLSLDEVLARRREMQMLQISQGIADAGVQAARSTLLPNIGITAGYAVTNPNFINGYQKEFGGSFMAGVVVNVPIFHPGAIFTLKAAKHKRNEVQYQIDEAGEKIALQLKKLTFELQVAQEKLRQVRSNSECAEQNLRLADESFRAGLIGLSDLMQAQTAWLSAQTDITEAEVEARMCHLYLQQALGKL